MTGNADDEIPKNGGGNYTENASWPRIISYNVNEDERPDELRVRWKVRIETGKKAEALNARQAQAVKELLIWVREHLRQQDPPQDSRSQSR